MMDPWDLIIFDIDGTLVETGTDELLPGVAYWFQYGADKRKMALVTNQGGVGLRAWMESGGFGEPDHYPTEEQARAHIEAVREQLEKDVAVYVCFAYQSKKSGKWAPLPDGIEEDDPEWDHNHRKPAPGMIFDAIKDAQTTRARTLMVGDSKEDEEAAENAGVKFQWANVFFGRNEDTP